MDDPYLLHCPHCHREWDVDPADDLCYADDKADNIVSTCEDCGKKYILTTDIQVYFYAEAIGLVDP